MNKNDILRGLNSVKRGVRKKSPEILIGLGIAGMITSTVLAVKATPKALMLIEAEKRRLNRELLEEAKKSGCEECNQITRLEPVDLIKVTWKCYIPAGITCMVSVACLIGSNSVNARRNAALATAYKISETAFNEYREKVVEEIGDTKEQVIRDKVAKDTVEKVPVKSSEVIVTRKGDTLCYDSISGRYFKADVEKIKSAVNELNRNMTYDMYVSLSDLYDLLDLPHTKISDDLGWNLDDGLVDIRFGSTISEDNEPCIVMDYTVAPRYDFSKLM